MMCRGLSQLRFSLAHLMEEKVRKRTLFHPVAVCAEKTTQQAQDCSLRKACLQGWPWLASGHWDFETVPPISKTDLG